MQQKRLGKGGLVALIVVLSAVPPLSTDMLMPALPDIAEYFQVSPALASLTITEFFVGMALGMLVLGPASDRFGRKPVLVASIAISAALALASAFSGSIYMLLALRFVQSVGAGGMVALGTALVKDCYEGQRMGRMLAVVTAISTFAPMLAPVIGAGLLAAAGWRSSFVVLAALFALALAGSLLLEEPLAEGDRARGGIAESIGRMFSIARDGSFTSMLLVGALALGPYMTYLAVSSFVYTGVFGVTPGEFSAFFAANAAVSLVGAFAYMRFGAPSVRRACTVALALAAASAALVLAFGHLSPFAFLASYALYAATGNYLRPMVTNELLKSREQDVGAASSLINFAFTMVGVLIMAVGSIELGDYVYSVGVSMAVWIAAAALLWAVRARKR